MSEFHFESPYCGQVMFKEEEIRKLAQKIRAIIDEMGIDKFCELITLSLRKYSKDYTITCMTEEAMKCDNMNR